MRKQTAIRLTALSLLLGGLWVASTQQRKNQPLRLEKVRDDLHVLFGPGGNIGVLTTNEGVILIDDKFERHAPEILAKVKTLTDKPVRYVLNTHQHGDHTGGNAALAKTAEIIAHENARANMQRNAQPGLPRITFAEEATVHLGGKEVRAIYFGRGHTNGDAVIYFPQQRAIHTGDLFVRGAPFIDYSSGGSALEWDATLNAVLQLEFDIVIPGHGAVANREDLVQWKEDYETFRTRARKLSREGKSPEEAAKLIKVDDLNGWTLGRLQLRSMSGLLDELRR